MNSVPIQDSEDTIKAFQWLNDNMNHGSVLLANFVFDSWALYYLEDDYPAIFFNYDLDSATELSIEKDFEATYFIWWNEDIGWHDLEVTGDFVSVFDSGRISIYKHV